MPFQIQLLETKIRFLETGDSRKEVHTLVKLNNVLGARQFGRLAFDYNRRFQQVELPMVRVTHPNGGTSEVLPSAITDVPNPAVEKFPAYHDVRQKFVRILGLQEGDTVEYRVITTTANHPMAPDFWLEHTFDRSGQVLEENYEVDLPEARNPQIQISEAANTAQQSKVGDSPNTRIIYRWNRVNKRPNEPESPLDPKTPDLTVTTFANWRVLSRKLTLLLEPTAGPQKSRLIDTSIMAKAAELTKGAESDLAKLEAIYRFVSQKISTVDLPIGVTGFHTRPEPEILASGYATAEDKFRLFAALSRSFAEPVEAFLLGAPEGYRTQLARPSLFDHLLIKELYDHRCANCESAAFWLDPSLEVAPFGMISSSIRGEPAFLLNDADQSGREPARWETVPLKLPFASFQKVKVAAELDNGGNLKANVSYQLRGDNELLLRVAFHQTPKEKWKEVAGLLALSDGFRGQIINVSASEPTATEKPFTVEYQLSQPKLVDWTKTPVRIPALLPQIGLPEPAKKTADRAKPKIELGTPLEVQTQVTVHLPSGTKVQAPVGTSVMRDYATYASQYTENVGALGAERHIHFLLREIAADRGADYDAFLRAVQNDQAQLFVLSRDRDFKSTSVK